MQIRNYNHETDYEAVTALLHDSSTYGGEFDAARDTKEKIDALEAQKPGSVLVAEVDGLVVGTVTLFEDGRSAWLYRFAVRVEYEPAATAALWTQAKANMKARGHSQVLVYAPAGNENFKQRYNQLGFATGGDYTAYFQDIA
jgi:predicted N-acetyltransferase YhbS